VAPAAGIDTVGSVADGRADDNAGVVGLGIAELGTTGAGTAYGGVGGTVDGPAANGGDGVRLDGGDKGAPEAV
jgi:hypothetical protein